MAFENMTVGHPYPHRQIGGKDQGERLSKILEKGVPLVRKAACSFTEEEAKNEPAF